YDLVFLDAFSPDIQPELWTQEVFEKLYAAMTHESALVTYCAKGAVRRAMQAAGFTTERLPGAKGKREMLRANKF
ncbi:MAG: MnmC family methyltransferase, partial [Chitinophagales bacterium]